MSIPMEDQGLDTAEASRVIHHPHIVAEIRELPPKDGWARYESTGRACLVCSCGTVTGFTDKADVHRQAAEHPAAHTRLGIHLDPADAEEIKARWRAQYGTPGAAHSVVPLDPQETDGEVHHAHPSATPVHDEQLPGHARTRLGEVR